MGWLSNPGRCERRLRPQHPRPTGKALPPPCQPLGSAPSAPKRLPGCQDGWSGYVPTSGESQCFRKAKVLSSIWGNRSRKGKGGGTQRVILRLGMWPSSLTHRNTPCQRAGSLLDTAFKKYFTWKRNGKFSSPFEGCFPTLFFFFPLSLLLYEAILTSSISENVECF